jgi:hypothetical protein
LSLAPRLFAASCSGSCCDSGNVLGGSNIMDYCIGSSVRFIGCYDTYIVYTCDACISGYYTRYKIDSDYPGEIYGCHYDPPACGTCNETVTDWVNVDSSRQRRTVTKTCASGCTCTNCSGTVTEYQCGANYYGTATNNSTSCTSCLNNGKKAVGNGDITDCYIPAGQEISDDTGKFTFDQDCHYSK